MTNEEKLQDYKAKLELVKRHFDVDYKYSTLIGFQIELEKFVKIIDDAERIKQDISDLECEVVDLTNEVSDLEDEIKDLKKEIKELKNKNLKNNES